MSRAFSIVLRLARCGGWPCRLVDTALSSTVPSRSVETACTAASVRCAPWGARCFSAGGGGDGGGGSQGSGVAATSGSSTSSSSTDSELRHQESWKEASQLAAEATRITEAGNLEAAMQLLRTELPRLVERYGQQDTSVGFLHNQLALWSFYSGDYPAAVQAARDAQQVWVKETGPASEAAAFHGIRLGMALTADGRPEEAFPLLERGMAVAAENYNQQLKKLEEMQPLAEDGGSPQPEGFSAADEAAMAASAEQQGMTLVMLERLGRAVLEAKFYRALSFLGVSGREVDAKWDDNGAGAAFFLEQEMSDALTDMLRWALPDDPIVSCALREHRRVVAQVGAAGLRRLHDDLEIHGQRLRDIILEATASRDG